MRVPSFGIEYNNIPKNINRKKQNSFVDYSAIQDYESINRKNNRKKIGLIIGGLAIIAAAGLAVLTKGKYKFGKNTPKVDLPLDLPPVKPIVTDTGLPASTGDSVVIKRITLTGKRFKKHGGSTATEDIAKKAGKSIAENKQVLYKDGKVYNAKTLASQGRKLNPFEADMVRHKRSKRVIELIPYDAEAERESLMKTFPPSKLTKLKWWAQRTFHGRKGMP